MSWMLQLIIDPRRPDLLKPEGAADMRFNSFLENTTGRKMRKVPTRAPETKGFPPVRRT